MQTTKAPALATSRGRKIDYNVKDWLLFHEAVSLQCFDDGPLCADADHSAWYCSCEEKWPQLGSNYTRYIYWMMWSQAHVRGEALGAECKWHNQTSDIAANQQVCQKDELQCSAQIRSGSFAPFLPSESIDTSSVFQYFNNLFSTLVQALHKPLKVEICDTDQPGPNVDKFSIFVFSQH